MKCLINNAGIELIKKYEGCVLHAYPDPGPTGEPWTIGYGQTNGVEPGMVWTQEEAEHDLIESINDVAAQVIKTCKRLNFVPTADQLAALTSFTYNLGLFNLLTLLGKSGFPLRASRIGDRMLYYDKAKGKVLDGLITRRKAERDLFLT